MHTDNEPGNGTIEFSGWDCDEDAGLDAYTYSQKVEERLEGLGLVGYRDIPVLDEEHISIFPGLDVGHYFDGRLPRVIRKLNLDQISALYSLYSNWYGYLIFQTRKVAAERSEYKRKKDFLWSFLRKQYKVIDPDTGKKFSDQAVSDMARTDYRFVVADAEYEELNVLYNTMLAMCEVADQDMQVVSREVTINQLKQQKELGGPNTTPSMRDRSWMPSQGDRDDERENARAKKALANTRTIRPGTKAGKVPSKTGGRKPGPKRPR